MPTLSNMRWKIKLYSLCKPLRSCSDASTLVINKNILRINKSSILFNA